MTIQTQITVKEADVADLSCDVLVLKYAQAFYGADAYVANRISSNPQEDIAPAPGDSVLLDSKGEIAARSVLFVGVIDLYQFDYEHIREFARLSLEILAKQMPSAAHVGMTIHGVGYGLDEEEAFMAQLGGILDAFRRGSIPGSLKRISIVERIPDRVRQLRQILKENNPIEPAVGQRPSSKRAAPSRRLASAGKGSKNKPHVFVAMPFGKTMVDVYTFGIEKPVRSAGYLCERIDMEFFVGDILERIKSRIETANLVVADLTGANANVYLEVGYAWAKARPTILLIKEGEEPRFDVRGQRCIVYETITDLSKQLKAFLSAFRNGSAAP